MDIGDLKPCRPEDRPMNRYSKWMEARSAAFAAASFKHYKTTEAKQKAADDDRPR